MSEIIYNIVSFAIAVSAISYLIYVTITYIKKTIKNINAIKIRIVFKSVLFALFIIEMILALILGESIGIEIFGAIIWAISTVGGFEKLNAAKRIHIMPDFRDINDSNIIDVAFKE